MRIAVPTLLCFVLGCAAVTSKSPESSTAKPPLLRKTKLSSDSVVLEIGFVDVPLDDPDWLRDVWAELDEQDRTPESRRQLHANGFRCGLVGVQLPTKLRKAIDAKQQGLRGVLNELSAGSETTLPSRRIQLRTGKTSQIITSAPRESMVVLLGKSDGLIGKTFEDAQTVISIKAFPSGDGQTRIELTPEIQFGPSRQRWRGRDGMFQLEAGRDRQVFNDLTIESDLAPGHTLALTSLDTRTSLGGNFFLGESAVQKILLIRLAQSQYDDLFDQQESSPESLTTEFDE